MAYESHSLDLFGLDARNLGENRGEVRVGIVWILGVGAMSRKLSGLNGRAPRTGGDVRYLNRWGPATTLSHFEAKYLSPSNESGSINEIFPGILP